MMKVTATIFAISLALLALLSGCASTTSQPTAEQMVPMKNTINEINEFENEMDQARQDQLDVLSPGWFAKADASFTKAKSGAEKGTQLTSILDNIKIAREHLANAKENAKVARTMLPQVIESRRMAHLAGAAKLEKEFAQVEGQFFKLTEAIEKNNINYTKNNASKVDDAYRNLELLAIKNEAIGNIRQVVGRADKNGAEKYAPQAFELAQRYLNETDEFITKNRYAKDEIRTRAQKALFFGNRAFVLTDQSKTLDTMKPEEKVLWTEAFLSKITTQLTARDSRDQNMSDQVENILQSIGNLQDDNKQISKQLTSTQKEFAEAKTSYDAQIDLLNQKLALYESKSLEEQKAKEMLLTDQKAKEAQLLKEKESILAKQLATARTLEEERQFNQKFIKIQNYFGADEAEAYKRGNQLIIRLKGMQFPVGKAIITSENYALLSKVQRAIENFEDPSVIVEGHTDSTGTREINNALSQQRADAVKNYLIANKTISAGKVVAQGYGSDKPLVSNATAEGRAANRRIDVIINPSTVPGQ
jgi:outer membrane protein OmpA-like peptidoglycan-associated protein